MGLNMSSQRKDFELYKQFAAVKALDGGKKKRGKSRNTGRGCGLGSDRPGNGSKDLAEVKSSTASVAGEELPNTSDLVLGNTSGAASSYPAGIWNSRQKENLRVKCARSVALAESLTSSLKSWKRILSCKQRRRRQRSSLPL